MRCKNIYEITEIYLKNKKKMCHLNVISALLLVVVYIQFCNTEITLQNANTLQTTNNSYNAQSSEEWFHPMKQTQNQKVEEVSLPFIVPDPLINVQQIHQENNHETDEIETDDIEESRTMYTQYLNEFAPNESTTSKALIKIMDEVDDSPQSPISAELSSNKPAKTFVHNLGTVAAPVLQVYDENTMIALIDTSPDALRKTEVLWKSEFNSSGKFIKFIINYRIIISLVSH